MLRHRCTERPCCTNVKGHTRIRLLAIPYSAAPYGVRMDWSRLQGRPVFYAWTPRGLGTLGLFYRQWERMQ